eukprot:4899124-Amphidinium_carterae.1
MNIAHGGAFGLLSFVIGSYVWHQLCWRLWTTAFSQRTDVHLIVHGCVEPGFPSSDYRVKIVEKCMCSSLALFSSDCRENPGVRTESSFASVTVFVTLAKTCWTNVVHVMDITNVLLVKLFVSFYIGLWSISAAVCIAPVKCHQRRQLTSADALKFLVKVLGQGLICACPSSLNSGHRGAGRRASSALGRVPL